MDKRNITQDPLNALQNFASRGSFNSEPISGQNTNQMLSGSGSGASSQFNQRTEPQMPNVQEIQISTNVGIGHGLGGSANVVPCNMHMNVVNNQGIQIVSAPNQIYIGSGEMNQMGSGVGASCAANQKQINPNIQCNSFDMPQIPVNSTNQNQMNTFLQMNQSRINENSPLNSGVNVVHQRRGNQQSIGKNMGNNQANKTEKLSIGIRVQAPQNLGSSGIGMSLKQGYNLFSETRGVSQQSSVGQTINQSLQQQHATSAQMIKTPACLTSMSNNNQRGQIANSSPNTNEDQLYREKYQQLTKYIEPLKRIVSKISNDGANVEKITKMSKLLEILVSPNRLVSLETLLKCEKALEKLDILNYTSQIFAKSSNPLHEAVKSTIQSPLGNHTINRTFKPALDAIFGTDIVSPTAKHPRITSDDTSSFSGHKIPHVLQGEIARSDQKFKISLDSSAPNNTNTIKLICCLDDIRLPCVPPICISIPEDYPSSSPSCSLPEQEYSATPFLLGVQNALTARISKLPKCHSLSHLLDTWEISVRQACSPKAAVACDITDIFFG